MELGLDFDDLDFEEKQTTVTASLTSYNAKICAPLWFEKSEVTEAGSEEQVLKFRADNNYHHGNYSRAAADYSRALDLLSPSNRVVYQDMAESLVRCYLHIDKHTQALELANSLMASANTPDQTMQYLLLLCQTLRAMGDYLGERDRLQQLISLHPQTASLWLQLATCCKHLTSDDQSVATCDKHLTSDDQSVVTSEKHRTSGDQSVATSRPTLIILTCYIRARVLLQHVYEAADGFIQTRKVRLIQQIEKEIELLNVDDSIIQRATKFLQKDVVNDHDPTRVRVDHTIDKKGENFDRKWFSWIEELAAGQSVNG